MPDLPDPRDFTIDHECVRSQIRWSRVKHSEEIDLREDEDGVYFSTPIDQGGVHASTALTVLSLIEYLRRKYVGETFDGSALFLFRMAQRLAGNTGNSPVGIRTTLKALKRYGVPPEEMLPFSTDCPEMLIGDISLLGFSREFCELMYFRVDGRGQSGKKTLSRVRTLLASGLPVIFGFSLPRSLGSGAELVYRPHFDSYAGGQTALAVGYNDNRLPGKQGALLVRFSWGPDWGDGGYGWLPYAMVKQGQARDFWTIAPPSGANSPLVE